MIRIKTNSYIKKESMTSFIPSITGIKNKFLAGIEGAQKALSPVLRGSVYSREGAVGGAVRDLQSGDSYSMSGIASSLKSTYVRDFNIHKEAVKKDPKTAPPPFLTINYKVYCKNKRMLHSNIQLLSEDENEFNFFVNVLISVLESAASAGINGIRFDDNMKMRFLGKDTDGYEAKDARQVRVNIIAMFANWFPEYYNKGVTLFEGYNTANGNPSC